MNKPFEIKSSGERKVFSTGMQRDIDETKIDYTLLRDGPMYERWAIHLNNGAKKYEPRNWMKAKTRAEYERFISSAARHFEQYLCGDRDEDHAAAVIFNLNGAEYVRDRMERRKNGRSS